MNDTSLQWHLRDLSRLFAHACNLFFPLRVDKGCNGWSTSSNPRWRSLPERPAAVAKLLNCRYQHNTSAGVDRERQLLDRTITRIRRTLTSRASSETSRWFAAGHVDRLIEFCGNLLLTGLQERTFPLKGDCLRNRTLGSRPARICRTDGRDNTTDIEIQKYVGLT